MLDIGADAPDATVFVKPREPVQLKQLQGGDPLLILFFPLAFSGVCTAEVCMVADDYGAYHDLEAKVVAISVDSPYVTEKFAEACGASFPILSDFNRDAIRAYDVERADFGGLKGVAERAVYIVAGDGTIAYRWQGENPGVMPPFDEIKSSLKKLKKR